MAPTLLATLALGACALAPPPAPPVPVVVPAETPAPPPCAAEVPASAEAGELQALLIYHQELRNLGPAELAREGAALGTPPRTLAQAIRKAMVLGQGRSSGDVAQAQAVLDAALIAAAPNDGLRPLASMLAARLADQRRLAEANDRLGQQLRDSQRRNEQLSEKLEALKAIEQRLPTMPAGPRPASPEAPR